MAIKFTNEPPQGIRASLKRTYQNITQVNIFYLGFTQLEKVNVSKWLMNFVHKYYKIMYVNMFIL